MRVRECGLRQRVGHHVLPVVEASEELRNRVTLRRAVKRRRPGTSTVAIDRDNIPEAKEIIREFKRKLTRLLQKGSPKRVYSVSVQLFPVDRGQSKESGQ